MARPSFALSLFCGTLAAAGLVASMAFGAPADSADAPQAHSDSLGAVASDTMMTANIKSQFIGQDRLEKSDISVTTVNGVVTLSGTVSGAAAKSTAEAIAGRVEGVKSVDDQLKSSATAGADADAGGIDQTRTEIELALTDGWITTRVKSELLMDSFSKGFEVNVITHGGVVALKGSLANQKDIDHIKDVARQVDGVKSVDASLLVVASS